MFKAEVLRQSGQRELTREQSKQSEVAWGKVMLGTVLAMLTIGLLYGLQLGVY